MKSSTVFSPALFILAVALVTPAAFAQTPDTAQTTTNTTVADDDDGDHGLWGLLGLIGLAGLIRRKDHQVDTARVDTTRRT